MEMRQCTTSPLYAYQKRSHISREIFWSILAISQYLVTGFKLLSQIKPRGHDVVCSWHVPSWNAHARHELAHLPAAKQLGSFRPPYLSGYRSVYGITLKHCASAAISAFGSLGFQSPTQRVAIRNPLAFLRQLGVNVIEVRPIAEFDKNHSWRYDPDLYGADRGLQSVHEPDVRPYQHQASPCCRSPLPIWSTAAVGRPFSHPRPTATTRSPSSHPHRPQPLATQ